jgi:hypothetical protein
MGEKTNNRSRSGKQQKNNVRSTREKAELLENRTTIAENIKRTQTEEKLKEQQNDYRGTSAIFIKTALKNV